MQRAPFPLAPALMALMALGLAPATPARAGIYSDDLSRCLVASTSSAEKTALVRWIFSNAALHPEVANITAISAEQRTQIDKTAALLLQKLLTQTCREPYGKAARYEGAIAMQTSFGVLGQVAMQELMSDPAVSQGFGAIGKYVDEAAIKAAADPSAPAPAPAK